MRRLVLALVGVVVGLAIGFLLGGLNTARLIGGGPTPETVVASSLQAVQRQSKLSVFAARSVVVITSSQARLFGFTAEKTLIVPGYVRYTLDLARLSRADLRWDAASRTLTVRAPALVIEGPQYNLADMREYKQGGLLFALTDAERDLDAANRARLNDAFLEQARAGTLLMMAREAGRDALERLFAVPLDAAGLEGAKVVVQLQGE